MKWIEFAIKHRNSRFTLLRLSARLIIRIEKKRADLMEERLEQMDIPLPDDPEAEAALFQKIKDQIQEQNKSKQES